MRLIMVVWVAAGLLARVTSAALDLPCSNLNGYPLRESEMKLHRLGAPTGDETVRFKAVLALPDPVSFDPTATGLRLLVLDNNWSSDDVVLDVAAPAAGWRMSATTGTWSYRGARGTNGIVRAVVKRIVANPAFGITRQYAVMIDARRGTYGTTSDLESHFVMLAFATSGLAANCAVQPFYPWLFVNSPPGTPPYEAEDWVPACKFRSDGRTMDCASGPRVGPCRVSMPNDMLLCDVQNAAAAEEQYRTATGSYYSGPCTGMPEFRPSPEVTCTATAGEDAFVVHTTSPQATYPSGCTWDGKSRATLVCF